MMRPLIIASLLVVAPAAADDAVPRDEPTAADVETAPLPGTESGRTDPAEHDSLLRNIGQGTLFVPRVAVQVTMAPVRASVWAFDRYKLVERWKQVFFNDAETYGMYPTAVLDSSYGFTVGARFVHRDLFGHREHLALRASTGGEFRAQADGGFRTGRLLGERAQLAVHGEFERRPHDAFYGIGNATEDMASYHRQELVRATTTLDLVAVDSLHVVGAGAITDLAYARSSDGPAIDMMYDASVLTGWSGLRNVYGELELRWDRRGYSSDFSQHHTFDTGFLLAAFTGRVHQLEAGADHWRFGGEAQQFFGIGAGPRAISTRLHVEGVSGAIEDVAFTELPQLGGKSLLRGYPRDRFRDRLAIVTSLEYTWDLGKYPMASVFVDVGRVFPGARDLEPTNVRMGYGISLQLHSDRNFLGSVSLASSVDGGVFVDLMFDPAFDIEPRVEQR
jgi:hypothetical protein